jgi:hypothetical protein
MDAELELKQGHNIADAAKVSLPIPLSLPPG